MAVRRVAVFVDMLGGYGRGILLGIANYVRTHEPWVFYGDPERAVAPVFDVGTWDGDGIIAQVHSPELRRMMLKSPVPIVNVSGRGQTVAGPEVRCDDQAVGRMAAKCLRDKGFRQFAYCGFAGHNYSERRGRAFEAELDRARLDCVYVELPPPQARQRGSWEAQDARLQAWIESLPRPVAVLACNDVRARQIAQICHRIGIRIPEELALLGVDNDQLICEMSNPPISSIDVSVDRIGYEAAALLDRLMDGQQPPEKPLLIPPNGVVTRRSSDVLAIDDADVAAAVRYIRTHPGKAIQVDEVVSQTASSRRVLERRFRKVLGRTILTEITLAHIDRAEQMLVYTDLSIDEVASRCGFNYVQQFNTTFRKHTGITPREYRRKFRSQ